MSEASLAFSDPDTVAAVARAERRRLALERVTEVGMAMIEEIAERTVHAPLHPEPRHDPFKGFAAVSRAVRLTVALEAKIDEWILAMRRGDVVPTTPLQTRTDAASAALRAGHDALRHADERLSDADPDDQEQDAERPESETECLIEREYETFRFFGDFDSGVAAIRADLGLAPGGDAPPPEEHSTSVAGACLRRSREGHNTKRHPGWRSPTPGGDPEIIQRRAPPNPPSTGGSST